MIQAIRLFEVFKTQFTDEQAKFIVEEVVKMDAEIEPKVVKVFDQRKDELATKLDLQKVKEEIVKDVDTLRVDMERGFKDNLKWTVATIIACTGISLAVSKLFH
jgi:hypothetical protein